MLKNHHRRSSVAMKEFPVYCGGTPIFFLPSYITAKREIDGQWKSIDRGRKKVFVSSPHIRGEKRDRKPNWG